MGEVEGMPKRPLMLLLASSLIIQMLVGVTGITVPIYAERMEASPMLIGVIGATGGMIYSFIPLVSGILTEKFRRKPFLVTSTFLYGLVCILYTLTEKPRMLIPVKALEWFSIAVFWPSVETLLTDLAEERLEETLRKFNLSWGFGTIIGPMIGGSLISIFEIKAPFIFSSILSLSLSLLAAIVVKEKPRENMRHLRGKDEVVAEKGAFALAMAIVSILLFSIVGGIIFNLFPAYAADLGIPEYEIGAIMLLNGVFRLIAFLKAYTIKSRIGSIFTFLFGSLMFASASSLTALSSTTILFSISFSAFGFGAGILYANSISLIFRRLSSIRGYASGVFESLIGAGYFLGSLAGGYVSEYSPNAPYILGALISLAASIFYIAGKIFQKTR